MNTEKFALKSKTILAALIAVLTAILPLVGVEFGAAEGALLSDTWDKIIIAVSGVAAIFGRFAAIDKVKL